MESKRLEQEKMEEETLRGAFDETCCSVARRTGLSVDASGRGAPPKLQKIMGRAVLAPGARAFLQEGAIPLEGGLVRGRVRHAAEELKTELPELLEALQQGSAKLALSPELESMLNEAKRDGLALGGDGELEAAGRPWQRW